MALLSREDIFGPTILPGFNGVGEINLEDYIGRPIPEIKGYTFSHVGSLDLEEDVDESDERWLNDAIREEGNTEDRIEQLENNFEIGGFKTIHDPGMGTEEEPVDGRGRAISAKRRGETKMPWYFYTKQSKGERCRVSGGIIRNLERDPATGATRNDVIRGGVYLIRKGELQNNDSDITYWLKHDLKIHKSFNQRNVTMILTGIKKQVDAGGDVVRLQKRPLWEGWILKHVGKKVDDQKVWLFSVDSGTYAYRCLCEAILEAIIHDRDPAEIVLYTNSLLVSDARDNAKKFLEILQSLVDATYKLVGKDYGLIMPMKKKSYKILGFIPQFLVDHDKYINDKVLIPDLNSY